MSFWLGAVLAGAVPFAFYLRTLAPTVYGVDSAELSTGAYLLGIVHPPGSPGYLLLGHAFTWLPVGDIGYRLNLFSASAAALSLCFLYAITRRLTGDTALAVLNSWFAGSTYYLWVTAVAAEVYALQGCFVLGAVALALRWRADRRPWTFHLLCFVLGFGLGVHPSLGLMLPGLAVLACVGLDDGRPGSRRLEIGALCGLLGLSVYAYLPLRHLADLPLNPARDYWHVDLASWDGFRWMVSGRAFERHFFALRLDALPAEIGPFGYHLWSNFSGLGALLGLVGLAGDFGRRPWLHAPLLLMFAGHLFFYLPYGAGDREMMFLPAYLIWAIWIGSGAGFLARRLTLGGRLGAATLAAMAAFTTAMNFALVDLSDDWSARERGEALLEALPRDAVFAGNWPDLRIVEYLQVVEHRRPDIEPIDFVFTTHPQRVAVLVEKVRTKRPVFVEDCARLTAIGLRCEYAEACDCYRLLPPQAGSTG